MNKLSSKISFHYKGALKILMVPDWILEGLGEVKHKKLCW